MTTTWIIAADASRARILQVTDREGHLEDVQDFVNPSARLHERDLTTDVEPRFNGHGGVGKPGSDRTGGPRSDREAKRRADYETEVFVRELGEFLDKARTAHRYDRLHLIAPPKFLGQLRKELGKEVQKLVAEELPKDLSWLNTRQLEQSLARGAR
ncbi:MAG TPA: host attachment protein [Burkholderiales bacterium]|nr:host attachment protein [Burkholderiales bacterium]